MRRITLQFLACRPCPLWCRVRHIKGGKNAAYGIFWQNCDLMPADRMKWGDSGSPYYFHYLNNSVQIHVYWRAKQMPVDVNGGLDIHMPDKTGNMRDIDTSGSQTRHSKMAEMVKSLNPVS